jgi:outer membrane murein-binding lipoprotein Lpp
MTLHPLFVAGVLEGFEGTIGEMVGRVEDQELNAQLDALRSQVEALRLCIEEPLKRVEGDRTPLEI